MPDSFYPFVDNGDSADSEPTLAVHHAARIAIFDDAAAAPRVVVVEPRDIRSYLEEITATVTKLAQEQGGKIPFTVIREVVENLIHAYFIEPTISILDQGNTIRFSDQGPGIKDKERALEYGTTSATTEMKRYIRGVGSGLPYAQQWLEDKGGSLTVEDNMHRGTVVTISLAQHEQDALPTSPQLDFDQAMQPTAAAAGYGQMPPYGAPQTPYQATYPAQQGYPMGMSPYPQQGFQQGGYQQGGYPAQAYAPQGVYPPQGAYGMPVGAQGGYGQPWQGAYQQNPYQQAPAANVSERGLLALQYLLTHDSVGPRDLNAIQQLSESTWSRELSQLEAQGLISKQGGQKRRLTPAGRVFLGLPPQ